MSRSSAKGVDAGSDTGCPRLNRSQVHAAHSQGQGVESDEWAFVGLDGHTWGVVPKAMIVAFWKKKLLAQTLLHHASQGVEQGRPLNNLYQQWKGAILGLTAAQSSLQLLLI